MIQPIHRQPTLSPLKKNGPLPQRPAGDHFTPSEPKPEIYSPGPPVRGSRLKLVLGGAALALGGAVVAGAMLAPPPVTIQVQMSTREAARATENLGYLNQFGSLRTDPSRLVDRLLHRRPQADAQQALAAMLRGQTVYFTPSGQTEAVAVQSPEQLRDLARHLKGENTRAQFREGARSLTEGFKGIGQQFKDGFNEALGR